MFDRIFVSRNSKVIDLIKLGDYLGRSLRENVKIFSIDDVTKEVTYLTSSKNVIKGNYSLAKGISLHNIQVESGDNFSDEAKFDSVINKEVSKFIKTIYEDSIPAATDQFSAILGLWGSRVKFKKSVEYIDGLEESYTTSNKIFDTEIFSRIEEIEESLVTYLKENKDKISLIPEIKSAVNLSNTVSVAFNTPKLTLEELKKQKTYILQEQDDSSIYDIICKEELIKKELLESKKNFSTIWATSSKITKLVSHVLDEDIGNLAYSLCAAIAEVPYLALATKKQLRTVIENNLSLGEDTTISDKDLKSYVSKIFEIKKPLKEVFLSLLSEKYGINIQTLNNIPSFRSLINTQVVIFETLAKLSEKGSVQKEILSEVSVFLKQKNGVESLDVNDYINYLFEKAGYSDLIVQENISTRVSFTDAIEELGSVEEVAEFILEKFKSKDIKTTTKGDESEGDEESILQHEDDPDIKEKPIKKKKKKKKEGEEEIVKEEVELAEEEEDTEDEELETDEEEENDEEGEEESVEEEEEETQLEDLSKDELMAALAELEELLPDSLDIDTDNEEEETE